MIGFAVRMSAIAALKPGYMVPLLGRVCSDALPENTSYPDDGCEYHPACLTCPFVVCRHDVKGGIRTIRHAVRNPQIIAMRADGALVDEIAARFGLSPRSVFRVLAKVTA